MNLKCRMGFHRWEPAHTLSVWRADLGRAVRIRSRACYRCGRTDEHVVRKKQTPLFVADEDSAS
jgi:hypothetical protein